MRIRLTITCAIAALGLVAAGCGGGGVETATFEVDAPPADQQPASDTEEAASDEKPEVEVPSGPPPKRLQTEDLEQGDGKVAREGDEVSVNYVGVSYSNGEEFDASYGRGPFTFTLGESQVIPGWHRGVAGMKVGGRRKLVIPPDLAYGEQGSPPEIGPNETLVFVVDLLEVK